METLKKSEAGTETEAGLDRRPYARPALMIYGSVKTLTQQRTGVDAESATGPPISPTGCSENFSRKDCISDRRAKENIVLVGTHSPGIGLYLFDYKLSHRQTWGYGRQFGVMADEVERVLPEAVCTDPDGYKMVDYDRLGISRVLK